MNALILGMLFYMNTKKFDNSPHSFWEDEDENEDRDNEEELDFKQSGGLFPEGGRPRKYF